MRGRAGLAVTTGFAVAALLAACSGAGGGSASTATAPSSPAATPTVSTSPGTATPSTTRPGAPDREPLRFSALGDVGQYKASGQVLDAIAARHDDLTLVVGDLSYRDPGEERTWCDFVLERFSADYPFELVAGNHEDDGPDGSIDVFRECLPNHLPGLVGDYGKQWYADVPADDPVMRVVMLSPDLEFQDGPDGAGPQELSYEKGTPEYAWTRQAIRGAHAAGIPWVVAGMHKPCLSMGRYECGSMDDLMNLLLAEHVDLVLAGHEHMYQRTVPIALGPGCPEVRPDGFDQRCVAPDAALGTTFVTVGSGGQELRDVNKDDSERRWFAAVSGADLDPAHGSVAVEVTQETLSLRFEPVGDGSFTDSLVIRR